MADSFSSFLAVRLPATGAYNNTWGATLNAQAINLLDAAITGWTTIDLGGTGAYSLPAMTQGAASNSRFFCLYLVSEATAAIVVTVPSSVVGKQYLINNQSGQSVTFTYGSGATVALASGALQFIWCDGSNCYGPSASAASANALNGVPYNYWMRAQRTATEIADSTVVTNLVTVPTAWEFTTVTEGPTTTIDCNNGNSQQLTLTGNRTMAAPVNTQDGMQIELWVIQDGTGGRTLTWNAVFLFPNGIAPVLGTAPGAIDKFLMKYSSTLNKWCVGQFANLNAGSGTTNAITISSNCIDWSLNAVLGTLGAAATINITVAKGVIIEASTTQTPAMDLSGLISGCTVNLTNYGYIQGRGGDGGDGAQAAYPGSGNTVVGATQGKAGGKAILGPGSGCTFNVTNGNGHIWGGGGGGGAGGAYDGVGGGTGCGNAAGAGGGAGGGRGGRGGRGVFISGAYSPGTDGLDGSLGVNGTYGAAGNSGTGANAGGGQSGTSQAGGNWGVAGANGTNPATTTTGHYAPYTTGGAAGKAIELSGGSVTFVSGSGSPNVMGAVS
jgi:hypothetical protein